MSKTTEALEKFKTENEAYISILRSAASHSPNKGELTKLIDEYAFLQQQLEATINDFERTMALEVDMQPYQQQLGKAKNSEQLNKTKKLIKSQFQRKIKTVETRTLNAISASFEAQKRLQKTRIVTSLPLGKISQPNPGDSCRRFTDEEALPKDVQEKIKSFNQKIDSLAENQDNTINGQKKAQEKSPVSSSEQAKGKAEKESSRNFVITSLQRNIASEKKKIQDLENKLDTVKVKINKSLQSENNLLGKAEERKKIKRESWGKTLFSKPKQSKSAEKPLITNISPEKELEERVKIDRGSQGKTLFSEPEQNFKQSESAKRPLRTKVTQEKEEVRDHLLNQFEALSCILNQKYEQLNVLKQEKHAHMVNGAYGEMQDLLQEWNVEEAQEDMEKMLEDINDFPNIEPAQAPGNLNATQEKMESMLDSIEIFDDEGQNFGSGPSNYHLGFFTSASSSSNPSSSSNSSSSSNNSSRPR